MYQHTNIIRQQSQESGNVMITIMVVMVLVMALVSTLVDHYLMNEARNIEESLAKVRVYWAMQGTANYVLSRAHHSSSNLPEDDSGKRNNLNTYFEELDSTETEQSYTYDYTIDPDSPPNYSLTIKGVAEKHPDNQEDGTVDNGRIILSMSLASTGSLELISDLPNQLQALNIDICLRPEPGESGSESSATVTSDCSEAKTGETTSDDGKAWIMEQYRK